MGVAFDQVFDLTKDHFHHHRLRTGPTAPEPSERGGEDDDASNEHKHGDGKDDEILRPEDLAEDGEAALDNIEQQERVAVDANPRSREHDDNERRGEPRAAVVPFARGLLGIKPAPVAVLIRRREVVAEVLPVDVLGDAVRVLRGSF